MAIKYPSGIQNFEELINQKMAYVDKTALIYKMANETKYNFLSRPRRFGKSLLVTTFKAYFEGKKELFKGLAIEKLEKDWIRYPVIHLDLSRGQYTSTEDLRSTLDLMLREYEDKYAVKPKDTYGEGSRLDLIIRATAKATGQRAVILVDEYDAPVFSTFNSDSRTRKECREIMSDFLCPIKAMDANIRFVFITGVFESSMLSAFGVLNNIKNYSLDDRYAGICGFSSEEILNSFRYSVEDLARSRGISLDNALSDLIESYGGYRFSEKGPEVCNPDAMLGAFPKNHFDDYTGTSDRIQTFLRELMQNDATLARLPEGIYMSRQTCLSPVEEAVNGAAAPYLYQSGMLSIRGYSYGIYNLGIPNNEARHAMERLGSSQ